MHQPDPDTAGETNVPSPRRVAVDVDGHVLRMGLNRPTDQNFFDFAMLEQLAAAYGRLERDDNLRVGLLYGHGADFCAGLELDDMIHRTDATGLHFVHDGGIDPWQTSGPQLTKPVVTVVQGAVITLAVELVLVSDIVIAAESAQFAQLEATRAMIPFGGSTIRFPRVAGWGNAMRWLLTGGRFDAAEAYRIGVVQEVVPDGSEFERGSALARRVAQSGPLATRAILRNAHLAIRDGELAAGQQLSPEFVRLARTEDVKIATEAFNAGGSPFNDGSTPEFLGR